MTSSALGRWGSHTWVCSYGNRLRPFQREEVQCEELPTGRAVTSFWTGAVGGAQCHCRWEVGPPAEEAESQPWEAGFQRVDACCGRCGQVPTLPSPT